MFKIVTPADELYRPEAAGYQLELESCRHLALEIIEVPAHASEDEFIEAAAGADAVYAKVRSRRITRRVIEGLARCRAICAPSVGVEMVDVEAATERGIPVTNVPDAYTEEVADHAMALLLACARRLPACDRHVRKDEWGRVRPMLRELPRLYGQTLGLVGFGRIARAVARRAVPFGLRVAAHDPFIDQTVMTAMGVQPLQLDELLAASHFISLHTPSTASARGLIGEPQFAAMKPGVVLINTARAHAVDENALVRALQRGHVAFAGLDVFATEPLPASSPFCAVDNVILTPHVSPVSSRFESERRRRVGLELSLVLSGQWPMCCVNPSVLAQGSLQRWQATSTERGMRS